MQSQELQDPDHGNSHEAEEKPSFTVQESWQQTAEARGYLNALLRRNRRRTFGLLEKPDLEHHSRSIPVLLKRLFLVGKSGVGKTSTIAKISGREISANHEETLGIQTHTIYWPIKLVQPKKVLLVQLELWDTGERALNKFEHILPTCKDSTEGVLFCFSYTDRHSWEDLPRLISTISSDDEKLKGVIGTHADCPNREVTAEEVEQFHKRSNLRVLPIANVDGPRMTSDPTALDGREGINEVTPFMNTLAQIILTHEQKIQSSLAVSLSCTPRELSPDVESPSQ